MVQNISITFVTITIIVIMKKKGEREEGVGTEGPEGGREEVKRNGGKN